jgi:hypothetical protein
MHVTYPVAHYRKTTETCHWRTGFHSNPERQLSYYVNDFYCSARIKWIPERQLQFHRAPKIPKYAFLRGNPSELPFLGEKSPEMAIVLYDS